MSLSTTSTRLSNTSREQQRAHGGSGLGKNKTLWKRLYFLNSILFKTSVGPSRVWGAGGLLQNFGAFWPLRILLLGVMGPSRGALSHPSRSGAAAAVALDTGPCCLLPWFLAGLLLLSRAECVGELTEPC